MGNNFTAYEYKEITVDAEQVSLYLDAYENFGWEANNKFPTIPPRGKVTLSFKRDRKIVNRVELTRLQRNFDACMDEIKLLENSKKTAASIISVITGIVGTAFMAGSVFAITAESPLIVLSVILAIPGVIGWALPWIMHKRIAQRRAAKIAPLIEQKYDELYEICEKGSRLL